MIGNREEILRWLHNQSKYKLFEIKEHKEKRGLSANAYCWTLIGKIAEAIESTKEEVYRDYIRNKGIYQVITLNSKAVDTFKEIWQQKGLGWICETSETKKEGFTDVVAYYGSSSYNTKQMSNFIAYVVEEAKELDIETLPQEELDSMIKDWEA